MNASALTRHRRVDTRILFDYIRPMKIATRSIALTEHLAIRAIENGWKVTKPLYVDWLVRFAVKFRRATEAELQEQKESEELRRTPFIRSREEFEAYLASNKPWVV